MCKDFGSNYYQCNGTCTGNVWGSDVYTSDSNVYSAAKHMGFLPGAFKKVLSPGRSSYNGTTRNGVGTLPYGAYSGSYYLVKEVGTPIDYQFKANLDAKLHDLTKFQNQVFNMSQKNLSLLTDMQAKMQNREFQFLKMEERLKLQITGNKMSHQKAIAELQAKIEQRERYIQERLELQIAEINRKSEQKINQNFTFLKEMLLGMKQFYSSEMKTGIKRISDLVNPNKLCSICQSNDQQTLFSPYNNAFYCKQCFQRCLTEGRYKVCEGGIGGYMIVDN